MALEKNDTRMTGTANSLDSSTQISVARVASGLFLLVLAIYVLSSPGRIDIIDGQARFDVAYNWLHSGQPLLTDSWIKPWMAVPGRHHLPYSYYGAPASVLPMPLLAVGALYDRDMSAGASQFLFSLTSPLLGAGISAFLFLFYIELGVTARRAFAWTLVSAFATMLWPLSNSTFDNVQHGFFAIAASYLGFLSSQRKSKVLALAGGLLASVLILYQEYFLIIIPALALFAVRWPVAKSQSKDEGISSWSSQISELKICVKDIFDLLRSALNGPGEARSSWLRFLLWSLTAAVVGIALSCWFNELRFGSAFHDGKFQFRSLRGFPMFGNPLAGFATLMLSPGKSIFLYSPTIFIALFGLRRLYCQQRTLVLGVCLSSATLVLFLSCISFAGGDWCWGPRYLVVLLPLLALAFPFASSALNWRRLIPIIIAGSFAIQLMAVSVENQRFFFQRGLKDFFWAEDPWFYFKDSALFARVGETISLKNGPPASAEYFNSIPAPNWCTYTILGPNPSLSRSMAPTWMKGFRIFYLPKPWPLWMSTVDPELRPIKVEAWLYSLTGMVLISLMCIYPLYLNRRILYKKLEPYNGAGQEAAAV